MQKIADSHTEITDTDDSTVPNASAQDPTDSGAHAHAALEQSLTELLSLGRVWASYGLNVGKLALRTAAHSQQVVANVLGDLADHLKPTEAVGGGESQTAVPSPRQSARG